MTKFICPGRAGPFFRHDHSLFLCQWIITSQARTGAKVYYQSGPGLVPVRAHGRHAGRRGYWQPFGGQCPRIPLKNETGTNPYYWTLTDPRGRVLTLTDPRAGINRYNVTVFKHALQPYCQQCACTASNAHMQLAAVEYLNISGLVIDFATSPVRTGNSFFAADPTDPGPNWS